MIPPNCFNPITKGLVTITPNQIKYQRYFIEQLEFRNHDIERTIIAMSKSFQSMPNNVREAHKHLTVAEKNEIIKELAMMGGGSN